MQNGVNHRTMPKTKDEASEASQTLLQIIEQNSADNAKLADKLNSVAKELHAGFEGTDRNPGLSKGASSLAS